MPRKSPNNWNPPGKRSGSRGTYEPEPPVSRPEETSRQLTDDRTSCRKEIDRVFGQPKHCPIRPKPGSLYCEEHQDEERAKKRK